MQPKITALALPIFLSQFLGLLAVFMTTLFIAEHDARALYWLAVYMPCHYWIIALFESLRVPAMALASRAGQQQPRHQYQLLSILIMRLSLLAVIMVLIPLAVFQCFPAFTAGFLALSTALEQHFFKNFAVAMLMSQLCLTLFYICCGVLHGTGLSRIALCCNTGAVCCSTLACWWLLHHTSLGIYSIASATGATYFLLWLLTLHTLNQHRLKHFRSYPILAKALPADLHQVSFRQICSLAVPVWSTYGVLIIGTMAFNHLFQPFGQSVLAAFGLALRVQSLILLPAIAIGQAVGILCHQHGAVTATLIKRGLTQCVVIYTVIGGWCYWGSEKILTYLIHERRICVFLNEYLRTLSFSYIGLGCLLCYCMIQDQLGYGCRSLLCMLGSYTFALIASKIVLLMRANYAVVYSVMALSNILGGAVMLLFFTQLLKLNPKLYSKETL